MTATPRPELAPLAGPPFDGDPAWRAHYTLPDGTPVVLRPMTSDDRDELERAYRDELSPKTRYLRFLGFMGELSPRMLTYLTDVDQKDHVAIVATITSADLKHERGVGVARFIRVKREPEVAEAAVTVVDDMQRRGVGTLLVRELERAAVAAGIRRLRAEVLESNATMRGILDGVGARAHAHGPKDGLVAYDIDLEGEPGRHVSPTLVAILRGAAETLAMTIRRLLPEEDLEEETSEG